MEEIKKGKWLVLSVIGTMLAISLIAIISYWIIVGFGDIVAQTVRFSLTALLCFFLYRGHKWAKIIIIILAILAFLIAVLGGVYSIFIIIMAIAYAYCAVILLASKSIKSFMENQKNKGAEVEVEVETES